MTTPMAWTLDRKPLTAEDKNEIRRLWLKIQGNRCGVCRADNQRHSSYGAKWVLWYCRDHDEGTCLKGQECVDCIYGTLCRLCMLHLSNLSRWDGYLPSGPVGPMDRYDWREAADLFTRLGDTSWPSRPASPPSGVDAQTD